MLDLCTRWVTHSLMVFGEFELASARELVFLPTWRLDDSEIWKHGI